MKITSSNTNRFNFIKTDSQSKNKRKINDNDELIKDSFIGKNPIQSTYVKPKKINEGEILRLKEESGQAYSQIRQLVIDLLKRQGYNVKQIENPNLQIDNIAIEEAMALIGPDGMLGAEKTSDRIVQFAIAISGGDKTKLERLKHAIDKGFKEVEKVLGELPDVSKETYNLIMEKLNRWAGESSRKIIIN